MQRTSAGSWKVAVAHTAWPVGNVHAQQLSCWSAAAQGCAPRTRGHGWACTPLRRLCTAAPACAAGVMAAEEQQGRGGKRERQAGGGSEARKRARGDDHAPSTDGAAGPSGRGEAGGAGSAEGREGLGRQQPQQQRGPGHWGPGGPREHGEGGGGGALQRHAFPSEAHRTCAVIQVGGRGMDAWVGGLCAATARPRLQVWLRKPTAPPRARLGIA